MIRIMDTIQFNERKEIQDIMRTINDYIKQNPEERNNKTLVHIMPNTYMTLCFIMKTFRRYRREHAGTFKIISPCFKIESAFLRLMGVKTEHTGMQYVYNTGIILNF